MDVTISREDLLELLEYAEYAIGTADTEYSCPPNDAERIFMLRMLKIAGKEVPDFFRTAYGWTQEN
jgi:hypothetical protein